MHKDDLDLLEKYYSGTLPANEKAVVEKRMADDADFKNAAEDYRYMVAGIQRFHEKKIMAKMTDWDTDLEQPKNKKNRAWLWIAASLIIILSATFLFRNQFNTSYKLYTSFYEVPQLPQLESPRGFNDVFELKKAAFKAYNNRDYEKSARLFDELLEFGSDLEIEFYRAIAFSESGKTDLAVSSLNHIINQSPEDKYKWYLGLVLLKADKREEAKEVFSQLKSSPQYGNSSTEILEKL